jgi:hypothetical protein
MKKSRMIPAFLIVLVIFSGAMGCEATYHSGFAAQAMKPSDLAQVKYRMLKPGAMGESTGFKFLWIPFASPTESEAKRDMLDRLRKEGVETTGKNIGFSNATADKGGFGIIGIIGAPTITLTADVVEILGAQPSKENGSPSGQPTSAGAP